MKRAAILLVGVLFACGQREHMTPSNGMSITSSAFENGAEIPKKYGCSGQSISPPLSFSGVPKNAKSLMLNVTDPDAPGGKFTHWNVWNIPPHDASIAEGHAPGGTEGGNDFGKNGWGAPCPPNGSHRYVFDLYALDATVPGRGSINGHVMAHAQLVGTYQK